MADRTPIAVYPTKTRLALLEHVRDAAVWHLGEKTETWDGRNVTARIRELERAGWVRLRAPGLSWQLTAAGRAVLAEVGSWTS